MTLLRIIGLLFLCPLLCAKTYYVDFAEGSDDNDGLTAASAWKHAPGDPNATANPVATLLKGGDMVLFKGGIIYRGNIVINASGDEGGCVVYKGDGWGEERAIIDGSDLLANWQPCRSAADAGGNTNYRDLYYTYIPAESSPFLLNLHEYDSREGVDKFLWMAQSPNPQDRYFYNRREELLPVKNENLTLTSVVSPEFFTQTDPDHWYGASLLIWTNPNWTVRAEIKEYVPSEHKVVLQEPLKKNAIYPDGREQSFAIFNSPYAIDEAGEYAVTPPNAEGLRKIILWPYNTSELDKRISASVRVNGFEIGDNSHVEIAGFDIRKFGGDELRQGIGILAYGDSARTDTVIRNNAIYHNLHGSKGYGGIFATSLKNSLIEGNEVYSNKNHAGIFLAKCEDTTVSKNTIHFTGNTALRLYTCSRVQVLSNRISNIYSTHANGITLYLGCCDILVANNFITKATTPITHQSSGNLYFVNNVTDGQDLYKNVNEWPVKAGGEIRTGKIVYLNNTFVNADGNISLAIGRDDNNEYIVINNILDGMTFSKKDNPKLTLHEYNLFVGRCFSQNEKYGWVDGKGEIYSDDSLERIFQDPGEMNFRLKRGSPAIGAGIDVSQYYPTEVFPDFNFSADIIGHPRKGWDMGAYGGD